LRLLGWDTVLPVELKAFSIDEAPEYDALWYTWGDTRMRFGLSCGSKLIAVPGDNLFCCLKTLAYRRSNRWIWVDAICINLQDEREKYHQIPLMREINTKASEVLAWLGDGTFLESLTLREDTITAIRAAILGPSPELQILRPGPRDKSEDQYSAPIPFKMIRETLMSIFHRLYFTRIWR
jgi:hypothetical protein